MTKSSQRSRCGFTLMEVIVAVALILALLGVMFDFASDLMASRDRLHEFAARQRAATTLIDRVEADLATCIVADAEAGAGVRGDEQSLRVLSRGVAISELATPGDASAMGDLQAAEYRFDADRKLIEGRREAMPSRAAGEAAFVPLGGEVHRVTFRYHDGDAWRDEFDSLRERRLPRAVEVAVWFEAPPGEEPRDATASESRSGSADDVEAEFLPTFDEEAAAMNPDRLGLDPIPPDRVRVILILDSEPGETTTPTEGAEPSS